LLIYLTEAHAQDEWPIGSRYNSKPCVNQPTSTEERCAIATKMCLELGVDPEAPHLPLLLDVVEQDNPFEKEYAAWPIRFYAIVNSALTFIAEPKHGMYDIAELDKWIDGLIW